MVSFFPGSKGAVVEALAALLQHLWFGQAAAVEARSLKRAIDGATDNFAGLAQHDSAEFLTFLLDMVHEVREAYYLFLLDMVHEDREAHCLFLLDMVHEDREAHCLFLLDITGTIISLTK